MKLSELLLHRHRAILWCAFGVIRLNCTGVGLFQKPCLMPDCILKGSCTGTYITPLVQSLVSPSNAGGFVSSWVSCCFTDTGLSYGVHLE